MKEVLQTSLGIQSYSQMMIEPGSLAFNKHRVEVMAMFIDFHVTSTPIVRPLFDDPWVVLKPQQMI